MTLGEMKTFLQALGHGTDTATQQGLFLTRAYLELAGRRRWSWLETANTAGLTITSGATTLTGFPTDVAYVESVNVDDGVSFQEPLTRIDSADWEELNFTDRDQGTPQYWAWIDRVVRTHPRADKTYNVELSYGQIPPASAFDTDLEVPAFDERFHVVVAWKAAAYLAFRQRDWAQWQSANAEYERIVREMEQAEDARGQRSHMRRTDYYDQVK